MEDDEIFADVAPMLFGDGFKKTMKEHVEAMRCIRKTSNKMTELFFQRGRPPRDNIITTTVGVATATEKRPVPPVLRQQLQQPQCRKRELPEEEPAPTVKRQRTLRDSARTPEIMYAYMNLPVLSILPELQHFTHL